jgi:hypothetical protein
MDVLTSTTKNVEINAVSPNIPTVLYTCADIRYWAVPASGGGDVGQNKVRSTCASVAGSDLRPYYSGHQVASLIFTYIFQLSQQPPRETLNISIQRVIDNLPLGGVVAG